MVDIQISILSNINVLDNALDEECVCTGVARGDLRYFTFQ